MVLNTTDFSTLNNSVLNEFMAAAGYVDTSVIHGLGNPPFIQGNWAAAEVSMSWALCEIEIDISYLVPPTTILQW